VHISHRENNVKKKMQRTSVAVPHYRLCTITTAFTGFLSAGVADVSTAPGRDKLTVARAHNKNNARKNFIVLEGQRLSRWLVCALSMSQRENYKQTCANTPRGMHAQCKQVCLYWLREDERWTSQMLLLLLQQLALRNVLLTPLWTAACIPARWHF